jgi:predicted DNA-binding helix-hairpin-helix protein
MKKAIPKEWVDIIKKENSKKSIVNICKNYVLTGICLAYLLTVILSKFCENTNHFCPNFAKYLHSITFQLTN